MNYSSELRKDPVSGDWVVIAPKRAKRPDQFLNKEKRKKVSKKGCPFEDPQKNGNSSPVLFYTGGNSGSSKKFSSKDWLVQIIENKYPAFSRKQKCASSLKRGPYEVVEGSGCHELLITRDHDRDFPDLGLSEVELVFKALKERYLMLAKDKCLAYISIFKNYGAKAGASIYHPHCQIIGLPIIPPAVSHSLSGSKKFFKKNKQCVHCQMILLEKKEKTRVVYENEGAIVFAPFVSREPFELRVFPKRHLPCFENSSDKEMGYVAEALQKALSKMKKRLGDPDYNFFIHTSPVAGKKKYRHYHWHIEILPKISISAGFELGTGIETTIVDPDEAAAILRRTS